MSLKTESQPKTIMPETDGYCIDCSEQVSQPAEKHKSDSDDAKAESMEKKTKKFLDNFIQTSSLYEGINTAKTYATWEKSPKVWQTNIIDSQEFRAELRSMLEKTVADKIYSDNKLNNMVCYMRDKAWLSGNKKRIYTRLAFKPDAIYYNLNDDKNRIVKICAGGYKKLFPEDFLDKDFVMYSTPSMAAQVLPKVAEDGKSLMDLLQPYLNLEENEQILLVVTIITWFLADIPKPVIVLQGGQGSGKTTLSRMLQMIVDPSKHLAFTMPKSKDDLGVALANNYMLSLDNLSQLPKDASDLLCSAVTGASTISRTLFTNNETTVVSYQNAILINGISINNFKPDFYDRCIQLELKRLQGNYKLTDSLFDNFTKDLPRILGEIFATLARAINVQSLEVNGNYRMANYVHWGERISLVLFDDKTVFLKAYDENREKVYRCISEENPVATVLESMLENILCNRKTCEFTPTELLSGLEEEAQKPKLRFARKSPNWPDTPQKLSYTLKRLVEYFASAGYLIKVGNGNKKNGVRYITITKI